MKTDQKICSLCSCFVFDICIPSPTKNIKNEKLTVGERTLGSMKQRRISREHLHIEREDL